MSTYLYCEPEAHYAVVAHPDPMDSARDVAVTVCGPDWRVDVLNMTEQTVRISVCGVEHPLSPTLQRMLCPISALLVERWDGDCVVGTRTVDPRAVAEPIELDALCAELLQADVVWPVQ